jgi:hypothetical protein
MSKERRAYKPRMVGGKVMMPTDLRRLHKCILDIEPSTISPMKCDPWPKASGRNLVPKLPPRKSQDRCSRSNRNYLIARTAAPSFAIDASQFGNRPSSDNGAARASICILSFLISEMSAHRHWGVKSP